ncbi:MAG: DNA polymerase III subunit epsilon [Anaerolineae bacterium]|nr:DNA polymerase III subunit epsilon [Anaerolineae bacterium]
MKNQQVATLIVVVGVVGVLLGTMLALLLVAWLGQSQLVGILFVVGFLLLAIGMVIAPWLRGYLAAPDRVAEDLHMIVNANPAHRVSVKESPGRLKPMVEAINSLAEQYQQSLETRDTQIQQSEAKVTDEKNKLAVLIEELNEGVVVCTMQGRILLYNSRASALLGHAESQTSGNGRVGFVGLGRSIFSLMDRNVLVTAAKSVIYYHEEKGVYNPAQLVIVAANGNLLRVRLIPIITRQQELTGFILSLQDVSQFGETSRQQYRQIDSLVKTVHASLADIQAIVTKMKGAEPATQAGLLEDIQSNTNSLNTELDKTAEAYAAELHLFDWRKEDILGSDLLWAIEQYANEELGITVAVDKPEAPVWLRIDSALCVQMMTHVMRRLRDEFGIDQPGLSLTSTEPLAALELIWPYKLAKLEIVQAWQDVEFTTNVTAVPVSLVQVVELHGGQVQWRTDETANSALLRLVLPTAQPKPVQVRPVSHGSRPEFYDFDLFQQPEYSSELAQRPLAELTFTVFDTETTGLRPAEGDEITSVSGIRIVNGRLLHQETFDQLVDPQRPLPPKSVEITGITPEMVAGQPTIEQVLPAFYAFAEDTVMVAHNAAFDMRCLQLKEAQTGLKFTQPVVDTLLLSAVLHPHYNDHSLEAIADRLGLNIIGRHSSLGDSIVTGEVLLKLIPLLAEKGLITLEQVQKEAQKNYLARLEY